MAEIFGTLVREKRLGLGLSLGQLASQVSRTAATVRAWERGERVPDAATIRKLASVLGADAAELQDAADGMADPVTTEAIEDSEPIGDYTTTAAASVAYVADNDEAAGSVVIDDVADELVEDVPLVDLPTEAVMVVNPGAGADTGNTAAVESSEESEGEPAPTAVPAMNEFQQAVAAVRKVYNTIFDPEKRYLYWIRGTLLLIGFYVLLRVGKDATSGLLDAFGDFLDTFGRGEKPAPVVDTLVSWGSRL
jgi:transcriptional regulator with XRE-family HTH domain